MDMTAVKEVDKEGVTTTDLRPAGKIRIEGEIYDAVSAEGDYITKGSRIKVVDYQAGQLYVVKSED